MTRPARLGGFQAVVRLTERRFLQQLIGSLQRNGVGRVGGLLPMLGWKAWHDVSTNAPRACDSCRATLHLPRNEPGFPDLVLVRGDTLWFVELKSDRGTLSDHQRDWLAALTAVRKVRVGVWRPKDIEAITEAMR